MNKKISLGAAIAFMLIVAAATFSMSMLYAMSTFNEKVYSVKERESTYSKIAEIDSYVRQNYIGSITETRLTDATAEGFLAGTGDPYAKYYDASNYARLLDDYSNKSVQIGIVTTMDESGYIRILEVYPDSPAQAVGLEVDDLIVNIDETDVSKDNYTEAVGMLRGEPGTKMTIVLRKGVEDTTLEITRRFVEVPSVNSSLLDNYIGLVTFKEFNDNTPDQFNKQVNSLIDQGAAGLIFDVRGVNTGTLRSVAQVLDKLLPEGVIVSSTNKNGETTVLETSDAREVALPMQVLVNEKTSGEAELFAQAIRDYNKGGIVGTTTAGKGTMQTTFPLTDGSAIRLTTARYNPPVSPSYDGVGVQPDFEVKMTEEQAALASAIGGVDNDPQLKKAVEAITVVIKSGGNLETLEPVAPSDQTSSSSSGDNSSEDENSSPDDAEGDEDSEDSEDSSSEDEEESSSEEEETSSEETSSEEDSSSEDAESSSDDEDEISSSEDEDASSEEESSSDGQ